MEQRLVEWILRLARSDFHWLGRFPLKGLRLAWRHRPGPFELGSKEAAVYPTGPYATKNPAQVGDLLIWVPQRIESFIIDDLTGRYGYSHITVDAGEVDAPSGKPVMVSVTVGQTVERIFQDGYAQRAHVRIPLSKAGVDAAEFAACVKSRLGEPYDNIEALTLGEIDDPAKQMCSGLASECLPEAVRCEIARAWRSGRLRRAGVSVHSPSDAPVTKAFISPNAFAQYYGAPQGHKLGGTEFQVEPHPA